MLSWTWTTRWTGYVNPEVKDFIEKIRPAALTVEGGRTRIPWRFAMVQAGHESRWGKAGLTLQANNLFGVTGDSWKAQGKPVYEIKTLEYDSQKKPYAVVRPFRKYDSWQASLDDWADLIERRYPQALAAARADDFPTFAKSLQEEGYATDPRYALQLCALFESTEDIA